MEKLLLIICMVMFCNCLAFAGDENLHVKHLKKQKRIITLEWKTYSISSSEKISLYGAKERKFINENIYWGEAGYGAVTGIRSGYLEGGLICGIQTQFSGLNIDLRLFAGAGGGGSAPQGGGFLVNPTIGIGKQIGDLGSVFMELGYVHFMNGNISSPSIAFNFNIRNWVLVYDK